MNKQKLHKRFDMSSLRDYARNCTLIWLLVGGLEGCSEPQDFAAQSNLRLTSAEKSQKLVLDAGDQKRVRSILASAATPNHRPVNPPASAPRGMRWSDVPLALEYACADVEMAITFTTKREGEYVFRLKTVDDRPGEMTITRVDDARLYVAAITVGRFGDDQQLARRLLDAFDHQLHQFGAKRKLTHADD